MTTLGRIEPLVDHPGAIPVSRPSFGFETADDRDDDDPGTRERPRSSSLEAASPLLTLDQVTRLSSKDPGVREAAWSAFYPRARAIAASKLRNHYGLRARFDDQDVDDTIDASMVILYRRCVQSPPENPVRHPYALLVSICVHLLPKVWRKREREREAIAFLASTAPEFTLPGALDEFDPDAHSLASGIAHWIMLQLDKGQDKMPKEIRAGLLGSIFQEAGLGHLLDDALARFPEARRRHCRLYHVEGLSTTEIAQHCGCGPSNISNNLRRSWLAFQVCASLRQGLEQVAFGRSPIRNPRFADPLLLSSLDSLFIPSK